MYRQTARNGAPIHFALFRVEVEYGFRKPAAVKIAGADKEEALCHVTGHKRKRRLKQSTLWWVEIIDPIDRIGSILPNEDAADLVAPRP